MKKQYYHLFIYFLVSAVLAGGMYAMGWISDPIPVKNFKFISCVVSFLLAIGLLIVHYKQKERNAYY